MVRLGHRSSWDHRRRKVGLDLGAAYVAVSREVVVVAAAAVDIEARKDLQGILVV